MVFAGDVRQYGLIRATIIGKIRGWCETNEKAKRYMFEGFYWSGHIKIDEMVEQIGLPLETIKKNLKWLIDNDIIIKDKFNKKRYDRTGWYRLNPTVLSGTYHSPVGNVPCSSQEPTHVPLGNVPQSCEELTIPTIPPTIPTNNQKTTTQPTNDFEIKKRKKVKSFFQILIDEKEIDERVVDNMTLTDAIEWLDKTFINKPNWRKDFANMKNIDKFILKYEREFHPSIRDFDIAYIRAYDIL